MKILDRQYFLIITIVLLSTGIMMGQTACPSVSAGQNVTLPCGVNCTSLTASPLVVGATTSYQASQINYSPQPYNGTPVAVRTNSYSPAIPLPFSFCFFGNTYNNVYIGANGLVSFNPANSQAYNDYQINDSIPNANTQADILNSILGPWQATDDSLRGNIYYEVIGTSPCRMFVISFDSIPLYGSSGSSNTSLCSGFLYSSSQVILYETTGIIDILVTHKDTCAEWNLGNAIEGVLNSTGNTAYTVPGRNGTRWSVQDDAWRFTPSGAPIYTTLWTENGDTVGTTNTVNVCPSTLQATYTVTVSYAPCAGGAPVVVSNSVQVSHATGWFIEIDSSADVSCAGLCNGAGWGSIVGNVNAVTSYGWSDTLGAPVNGGANSLSVDNLCPGVYDFTATDGTCVQVQQVTISVNSANSLVVNPSARNATCNQFADGWAAANPSRGTPPYTYLWNYDNTNTDTISGLIAGNYAVTVTDQQGCSVTGSETVTQPQALNISATPTPVTCAGISDGMIQVDITGGTPPYTSSASPDGVIFYAADTTGLINSLSAGGYTVYVIDNNGCSATYELTVPDATPDNYIVTTVPTTCYYPPSNDGEISISYGANTPYSFSIDGGPLQSDYQFFNVSEGTHTILAVNGKGCDSTFHVTVGRPLPIIASVTPDSITIPLGGSQSVLVNYQNDSIPTFEWVPSLGISCPVCPDPVVGPYISGNYIVYVRLDGENCYDSATLYVTVLPNDTVFIPNAFTPNNDGNNDFFQVYGTTIKTLDLKIFDRWGQLVFHTSDQFNGWDGSYKGQFLMPQVLVYVANITFLDNTQLQKEGSITLLK